MNSENKTPQLIIHDASAGSGKTFTLVKNYLQICLNPDEPIDIYTKILAITFTNKAAKEMKDRILEQLEDFIKPSPKNDFILDEFSKLFNCNKNLLKKRSFRILQSILHNFSQFSVSTIDKFMLRIIRSIQYEIGLKDSFELIMDYDEWFEESIAELIDDAEKSKKTETFLFDFIQNQILEDKSWNLEYSITQIASNLVQEEYKSHMGKIFENYNFDEVLNLKSKLKLKKTELEQLLELVHKNYLEIVNKHKLTLSDFARKSCPVFKVFSDPNLKIVSKNLETVKFDSLIKRLNETKFFTAATLKSIAFQNIQIELEEFCSIHLPIISKIYLYNLLVKKIDNQIKQLQFEYLLNDKLNSYLENNHKLPIGSLNGIIDSFIKKEEIPMLMMKMGEKYEYIFIDEFQDTSDTQWSNLYPFVENVLANGYQAHLIGDAKQSIYRFRGGDVNILLNIKENRNKEFYDIIDAPALTSNWRSGKEIVEFNNRLFSETLINDLNTPTYSKIYSEASQIVKVNQTTYVEIDSIAVEKDEITVSNVSKIESKISSALDRGFKLNDICILCRTSSEITEIANFLLQKEIPFTNADSLMVFSDAQVKFLYQNLEYQVDSNNDLLRADILSYIYFDILGKTEYFSDWYKDSKDLSIAEICKDNTLIIPERIENNYFEYIEGLISGFNLSKNIYTLQFLEILFQHSSKGVNQIQDFLKLAKKGMEKWKITPKDDQIAVKILTIHKSKGLEYPIVILPFLHKWTISNSKDEQWYNIESFFPEIPQIKTSFSDKIVEHLPEEFIGFIKDVKDEFTENNIFDFINLFYVACTRAAKELYIINVIHPPKKEKNYLSQKQNLSDFIMAYFIPPEHWSSDFAQDFGNKVELETDKINTTETELEHHYSIKSQSTNTNWGTKIKIAQNDQYNWTFEEQISPQQQGNHIHNILALIKDRSQADKALNMYFSIRWIPQKDKNKWREIILKIINHPELFDYFGENITVWNERDWLGINGETLRPDKVVKLSSGNIVILDYKTGKPDSSHTKQVEEYARQLAFSNFTIEKCVLVYTENIEIKTF